MALSRKKIFPFLTFLVAGSLSVFLSWWLYQQEKEQIQREVELTAFSVKKEIRARFEPPVLALSQMAKHWGFKGGMERREWEKHALILREQYRIFQAIEWVDSTFHVRWISPVQGNEKARDLNLAFEENRRIALTNARDTRRVLATGIIDLVQGGKGFLVYVPIYVQDQFEGFIVGVFQVEAFMTAVLQGDYLRHVGLEVYDQGNKFYEVGKIDDEIPEWVHRTDIRFYGHPWNLKLGFTPDYINLICSEAPHLVILFGLGLSFLLSMSIYFSGIARENQIRAEQANKAKSEFLARISHEFRTPMNAILGYGQLFRKQSESLTPEQREFVDVIMKSGYHLLDLINEMLEISQIERGEISLEKEELDVKALFHDVVVSLKPMADERKITVIKDFPEEEEILISNDKTLLRQVLFNLVSNSIKYNKEGGNIWLKLRNNHRSVIEIEVKDTGHGIPREKIGEVFNPFTRAENSPDRPEGSGLGLYITKKLVELMRGTISVESQRNNGTTFSIRLPVKNDYQIVGDARMEIPGREGYFGLRK